MLDVRERTRLRRVLYAKPTIILFAFLVALMLHGVWGIYQKSQEAVAKRDKAVAELAGLATREKELREDIARLSTGDGLEAEIRDRFMVAKEGEKVMIIADPDATKVHTVTVDENSPSLLETMMSAVGLGRK
ncbi:MAG TPA: septum formation initiator family protein [Candidatus Paceibacterota bacterium]